MTQAKRQDYFVYVGAARGDDGADGIYIYRLDMATGALTSIGSVLDIHNPSFLASHPNGRMLYAIDEDRSQSPSEAYVRAYAINPQTGELTFVNRQPSHGQGLCHLMTDRNGRFLFTAHYSGGSISVLPLREDGGLGEATDVIQHEGSSVHPRQDTAHPHSIYPDANTRFVFVPDLGLDKVVIYRFDGENGKLIAHEPPHARVAPGSGPRHLAFHPNGRHVYVINELASTITAFTYDGERGILDEIQTISTLPGGYPGDDNTTAEIAVHPSGRFVYGSNRGHDSIAQFVVDPDTGKLTANGHVSTRGGHPRHFALDPTGTYLFAENRDSNNIVVFRVDTETGRLEPTGHVTEVPRPVCIKMIPVQD